MDYNKNAGGTWKVHRRRFRNRRFGGSVMSVCVRMCFCNAIVKASKVTYLEFSLYDGAVLR